ncbi:Protein of unknown function [Pyronema omphalodes CBS 100304]|uniref:Ecp2 effector protein domain-containing protein n=1 Tax=Pyronema omphalodes (strain CBS 100304) TaxID=1076935 RepID=U4LPU2_PYROM|nr:Protein of unknown function [Pyronema omphalodes CBS 100304]
MQFTTLVSVLAMTAMAAASPVSPVPISDHPLLEKRASIGCSMKDLWAAPSGSMDGVINNLIKTTPTVKSVPGTSRLAATTVTDGLQLSAMLMTDSTLLFGNTLGSRREIGQMARQVYDSCKQEEIVQGWINDDSCGETWVEIGRTPNACKASSYMGFIWISLGSLMYLLRFSVGECHGG